jgi:hypothetical protein
MERRTNIPGNIANKMSHERSWFFIIAIRPRMIAARPHKSINIVKEEFTTWLQCSTAEKGFNIIETMINRIMNDAPSPIDHQPRRVMGHPRIRCISGCCEGVALPGNPESVFILRLLCKYW